MKNSKIRTIAFMALYIALYIVLKFVGYLIPFLQMPNGGSIELELIAVFIASYHLGWLKGLGVAVLSWLITIIFGFPMYFVNPVQIFLDYVGPLAVCGIASALWPSYNASKPASIILALAVGVGAYFGVTKSWNGGTVTAVAAVIVAICAAAFIYWFTESIKDFGVVISMLLKYFLQVLSGVFFWMPEGEAAGSAYAWTFSLGYNLWYNLVTMVVCIIVVPLLIDRLKKANVKFVA